MRRCCNKFACIAFVWPKGETTHDHVGELVIDVARCACPKNEAHIIASGREPEVILVIANIGLYGLMKHWIRRGAWDLTAVNVTAVDMGEVKPCKSGGFPGKLVLIKRALQRLESGDRKYTIY